MLDAKKVLSIAQAYTDESIAGAGALKGDPCQIESITSITGGHRVTFLWVDDNGNEFRDYMDVMDGEKGATGASGQDGDDGVGISSIDFKETDASGNNVYTVTLTDNTTYDITCPKGSKGDTGATGASGQDGDDGVGISSIDFKETDASGNNVYTITLTDNTTYDITCPKGSKGDTGETGATGATGATGNGITSITKTGTSGLVDTYTILFTDGTTTTFNVTNGQNGTGTGDMLQADYDPQDVVKDAGGIVAYIEELSTVTSKTLASSGTSVEFDVPTSGDNIIEFFSSDGSNYTSIDTTVSGKVTLTYDAVASARTITCRITEV